MGQMAQIGTGETACSGRSEFKPMQIPVVTEPEKNLLGGGCRGHYLGSQWNVQTSTSTTTHALSVDLPRQATNNKSCAARRLSKHKWTLRAAHTHTHTHTHTHRERERERERERAVRVCFSSAQGRCKTHNKNRFPCILTETLMEALSQSWATPH